MKTLKVRPVLVESKIPTDLLICGVDGHLHKTEFYGSAMESVFGKDKYQELILISLEDEKIDEGDRVIYIMEDGYISDLIVDDTINIYPERWSGFKKVIARQSQISPEYISKFIEQYNNGCVEDLEIMMEYVNSWSKLLVEKRGDPIKYHIQPKLTNGFVTIVEKEPTIYTEDEVKLLCHYAMEFAQDRREFAYELIDDWFEVNKKK